MEKDLQDLEEATERVRVFAERTYAHRAPKQEATDEPPVTFKELDEALDAVTAVFTKYNTIITLRALANAEPVAQYDTHECFTFAWVEEDKEH